MTKNKKNYFNLKQHNFQQSQRSCDDCHQVKTRNEMNTIKKLGVCQRFQVKISEETSFSFAEWFVSTIKLRYSGNQQMSLSLTSMMAKPAKNSPKYTRTALIIL